MRIKINIFGRIMILVLVLLIPVIILNTYSNNKTIEVIRDEIKTSNINQQIFFTAQIDTAVNQLSTILNILSTDSSIIGIALQNNSSQSDYYNITETKKSIKEKLSFQSLSANWKNEISIYFPDTKSVISGNSKVKFDSQFLHEHVSLEWSFIGNTSHESGEFVRFLTTPFFAYKNIDKAVAVLEVNFSSENMVLMLDQFKHGGEGDPFLYLNSKETIVNSTANKEIIDKLIVRLDGQLKEGLSSKIINVEGKNYLVSLNKIQSIGWYMINYVLLDEILRPINAFRNMFYYIVGLLLLMGGMASFLLYRYVQVPIRKLISAVKQLEMGIFTTRVSLNQNNEFTYLFERFNQMTSQTQSLIKNVYEEKIHSREVTLKQLQSQINPHFLYNSFAFIKSMTQLGEKDAVIAMVSNLSKYYRYTTRVENQMTTLQNELNMVNNYLSIQNLQMNRMHFEINVPESMLHLQVPRLILQPIVENAIVHGIEPKKGKGTLLITGCRDGELYKILVEDNGVGMEQGPMEELHRKLELPMDEQMGCGVWNVHQRLFHQFGNGAGLYFSISQFGGLCAELCWFSEKHKS